MAEQQLPLPPHEDDDSPESFAQRIREMYANQITARHELIDASDSGDEAYFESLLEDLTHEALRENSEFNENAKKLRTNAVKGDEAVALRVRQRQLYGEYKLAILSEAGITPEQAMSEMDRCKVTIKKLIDERVIEAERGEPLNVLEALGILQNDDKGEQRFVYPRDLLPAATDAKWETYLETVRIHIKKGLALKNGLVQQADVQNAEESRVLAHNALTRDLHEILGLDNLKDWDFKKTRDLIAKMRDNRFPTVETGERAVTEKAVLEGVIGAHAVGALTRRLSDLHK